MIEKSAAFKDGGLIDITFDEGNPPFTYSATASTTPTPTARLSRPAERVLRHCADAAGENLFGKNVNTEPTGPNSTLGTDSQRATSSTRARQQLLHRPAAGLHPDDTRLVPSDCVPGIVRGGSGTQPGGRATTRSPATPSSTYVEDPSILADDTGRQVTDTVDSTGTGGGSPIPPNTFVGTVTDTGPDFPATNTGLR
jgi:hypothetical protein